MEFRPDINGLRAVAVVAVALYHFGVGGFGGGYVGVDVFFVISGYFMTGIICSGMSAGSFSLPGFYAARARRIVPALAALIALVLIFGFFYLIQVDYRLLAKHSVASITFLSNFIFWRERGYFDAASHENWLLHTWSLSVEWQFYLLLPVLLVALAKFRDGKFLGRGIEIAFVLSFVLSIVATPLVPTASFYFLPTRAWEFLAGGLVFLHANRLRSRVPSAAAWVGIVLILVSVVGFSNDLRYPGYWAILPVLGSALVLSARSGNMLLTNHVSQFFGHVSYSFYLWHWPLVVGARYFDLPLTAAGAVLVFAASTVMASASYRLVEMPARRKASVLTSTRDLLRWGGAVSAIAVVATAIFLSQGWPQRLPKPVAAAASEALNINPRRDDCMLQSGMELRLPECVIGDAASPSAALWGDSHANALFGAVGDALSEKRRSAVFYGYGSCPPISGFSIRNAEAEAQCRHFNELVLARLLSSTEIRDVFLAARWSSYSGGDDNLAGPPNAPSGGSGSQSTDPTRSGAFAGRLIETACILAKAGKNVHVVAPTPEMVYNVPKLTAKILLLKWSRLDIEISRSDYDRRHAAVLGALERARMRCGVQVLDPRSYLCDESRCYGTKGRRPLYYDDHHLSEFGNRLLLPMFATALADPPADFRPPAARGLLPAQELAR